VLYDLDDADSGGVVHAARSEYSIVYGTNDYHKGDNSLDLFWSDSR